MENLIQDLKTYLQESLGVHVELQPWKGIGDFPFFFRDLYVFYTALLLGKSYIFAVVRESGVITPSLVRKHFEQLQAKAETPCIYVCRDASTYNRQRLIKQGVQFVVPRRQIYLPFLGIDWHDNTRYNRTHPVVSKMAPSTQAVVIYALNRQDEKQFIPLELSKALNYTSMTMSRALNELEAFGLGKTIRKGKERHFSFTKYRSLLWAQAEPLMLSPVKKRIWLKLKRSINEIESVGALAGLSALSELSMLSLPIHPIYAVSAQDWRVLQQSGSVQELPSEEEADIELEVWSYDPNLFKKQKFIDLFSLYLSLRENQDERVAAALKKMMKAIQW